MSEHLERRQMELGHERLPAAGGDRHLPAPDPIARDYLLLALRLGKVLPGLVDAYFGPADLLAAVEAEAPHSASRLREDASALAARLPREVEAEDRLSWLQAQLVALEAQALMLTGDPLPYLDYAECLLGIAPERTPEAVFESAEGDLARLLPSGEMRKENVRDRLAAWNAQFVIAPDRLPAVVEWLTADLRDRADRILGLPAGEHVEFEYVSGGPWSAFNEYAGGFRSLIEVNTEQVSTPSALIAMTAAECYPGRHTEHAWKERRLVGEMGRLEASVSLLNTPEALIGEGLAFMGERMIAPDDSMPGLLLELFDRGGLPIAADPAAARDAADKGARVARAVSSLRSVTANAAIMLHAEGTSRRDVAAYLRRYLLSSPDRTDRQMAVIEDPIGKVQVLVGPAGERLLRRWFELVPATEQVYRFSRLLREQLTPAAIAAEVASTGFGGAGWQ
jgi:hypothetical protein